MPDYKLGKIYRLSIGHLVYIGSTTQPLLSMRLGTHTSNYKRWVNGSKKYVTSYELFKVGTPTIELVESYPCNSRDELNAREGHHQRLNVCVNKNMAGQTHEEYRAANRAKRCEQNKHYRAANQDKINDYQKQYYDANKEKLCKYHHMRYAHNKRIELLTLFIQNHIRKIKSI